MVEINGLNKLHPLYQEDLANVLSIPGIEGLKGKQFLITGASGLIGVCLLDALHKDTVFVASHLYRIETYYLLDGIFQREVVEMTGHSEIFQLVINKIYSFLTSDFIQVFKHFRQ